VHLGQANVASLLSPVVVVAVVAELEAGSLPAGYRGDSEDRGVGDLGGGCCGELSSTPGDGLIPQARHGGTDPTGVTCGM